MKDYELLPLCMFISSKYRKLTSKQRDLLHSMRHYYFAENCKDGIVDFPHSVSVEYGLYPKSNTRDLYRDINSLVENGFVEKYGQGLCGKYFYKLNDIAESEE